MSREPQHLFAGKTYPTGEVLVYVKKLNRMRVMRENGPGTYWIQMCHFAFRGPDGVTRRGRFGQSMADTIENGQTDDYQPVPVSDPQCWPKFPDLTAK